MTGTRIRSIIVPAALAAVGVWLLVGCLYVPTFGPVISGKDAAKAVGAAGSKRPLRTGQASVADVRRVLGEPPFASDDGRVLAYPWTVRNGLAVWPLCFAAYPVRGQRTLVLRFDANGFLQSFRVLMQDEPVVNLYYNEPQSPLLPEEIENDLRSARLAEVQRRHASTRPATVPTTQPR
jgi:hypothetical protein